MALTLTIVQPYYRNPGMLELQIRNRMAQSPRVKMAVEWLVVDDCSPEPAEDVFAGYSGVDLGEMKLLRVDKEIPWNQHGCRNLGAREARGRWLQMQDMDRVLLPFDQDLVLSKILEEKMVPAHHYRGRGINVKRELPVSDYKPIVNQYWVYRPVYLETGGYDEDYCGCYGGDGPMLKEMENQAPGRTLKDVIMLRYDRHIVPDSTTTSLSRDREEFLRRSRRKRAENNIKPQNPVRFPWHEISLS